ncbi:MAG: hypothetical protein Q7K65_04550 [Candidatus Buchananbacteria bacterium]|nr:hypothetical protein [Candidatus Buchananbacteria bacterium]
MNILSFFITFLFFIFIVGAIINILIKTIRLLYRGFRYLIGRPLPPKPKSVCHRSAYCHPTCPGCSDDQNGQ